MNGLSNIKHVIILMQENRSFDEYFGTLLNALGFSDPSYDFENPGLPCRPFRNSTFSANGELRAVLPHDWPHMQAYYADKFNPPSAGNQNMGYYAANDIPYHWVLANTFTICDHYLMSVLDGTAPNRLYLMSGCLQDPAQFPPNPPGWTPPPPGANNIPQCGDAITGNPGNPPAVPLQGTNPFINYPNDPTQQFPVAAGSPCMLSWKSYPSLLASANPSGITWYVYDETNDVDYTVMDEPPNPANGWGSLNVLNTFEDPSFGNLPPPAGGGLRSFLDDVANGNLPTISWLIPPLGATEWENNPVSMGAAYIAQRLDALLAQPALWDNTVFILVYDESGGDFDHFTPNPPLVPSSSTVAGTVETYVQGQPIGPGFRVPAIIISPWTVNPNKKPGWDASGGQAKVSSQLMDHTAIVQLLELMTGVQCTNIAQFRRDNFPWGTEAVWDSIFDWANPFTANSVRQMLPAPSDVMTYQTNALQRLLPYLTGTADTPADLNLETNQPNSAYNPAPSPDAAWPPLQQQCYFLELSQIEFSIDDVEAVQKTQGGMPASFSYAVVLDGFETNEMAGLVFNAAAPAQPLPRSLFPTLYLWLTADDSADAGAINGMQISNMQTTPAPPSAPQLPPDNMPAMSDAQRWTISFDLVFNDPGTAFSNVNSGHMVNLLLNATFSSNLDWSTSIPITLVAGADPFMLTGPIQYLATDLRAFQVLDGPVSNPFGVAYSGDPNMYITDILRLLNNNDPSVAALAGVFDQDPANAADPHAAEAAASQVSHYPTAQENGNTYPVYNFAIARVTLQGLTTPANNVQVFFRLFPAPSAGTYFTTYGAGAYPSVAANYSNSNLRMPTVGNVNGQVVTIPFFAASRNSVSTTSPDPANWQASIRPLASGEPVYKYFGCWLDINQQNVWITYTDSENGTQTTFQLLSAAASEHQCLVAEISYQPLAIQPGAIPGLTTDLIAQRNLAVLGGTS
jgi:phospholipase C